MLDELTLHTAAQLAELIKARAVSPVEIMRAHLSRIERLNPKLNAIVTLAPDAIERAREAEAAMMRGEDVGPLHGVPVTVKDTIDTKGLRTTSGSLIRQTHVPDTDAPSVARLMAAGAIVLGKTNVPEMAIPYECDNPLFGRTNNPYELSVTSGGSSGGEAGAISACLSPAGIGSDLSGSIRVPAHFCGITGLTPTPGRVAAEGHFPSVTGTLSEGAVIGPMARNIEDLSLLMGVLSETTWASPLTTEAKRVTPWASIRGQRIASYADEESAPISEETRQAIHMALQALSDRGLVIVDAEPPCLKSAMNLWMGLFSDVATRQMREVYRGREEQAGPKVRAVLASEENISADEYPEISAQRNALRSELVRWMHDTPFIISPVGSVPAFEHGARRVDVDGQSISVFSAFGYSRVVNVLGLPSVSVPVIRTRKGLPIGVQIIGRPFAEESLLVAASIVEAALGGWTAPPDMSIP